MKPKAVAITKQGLLCRTCSCQITSISRQDIQFLYDACPNQKCPLAAFDDSAFPKSPDKELYYYTDKSPAWIHDTTEQSVTLYVEPPVSNF